MESFELTLQSTDEITAYIAENHLAHYVEVSEICYTLIRGKTDHLFAGIEMPQMLG